MSAVRAFVVDDEEHSRASALSLLGREQQWQVIAECDSSASLRAALARTIPDVLFLDIRIPGEDGLTLARQLQTLARPPLIVFTTAFEEYAVAAFDVQAVDYLLKPFDDARFRTSLRRVERTMQSRTNRVASPSQYAQRLVIRSIGRVQFVNVEQIEWLEASGNYVEIHTARESFLHRERLRVLETQLDPAVFVRIHRSAMVNRASIKEVRPIAGGDYSIVLKCGERLRMSRTYRSTFDPLGG